MQKLFAGKISFITLSVIILSLLSGCSKDNIGISGPEQPTEDTISVSGMSPELSGEENRAALQKAISHGGTFRIDAPGDYKIGGSVFLFNNTKLIFGKGVRIVKDNTGETFSHVFINEGATSRTYNHNIELNGLNLVVNGVDKANDMIYGLRGQVAFFYAKNIAIKNFTCLDLEDIQFCLQVCTFDSLTIDNVHIEGKKDGIHLGRGKNFHISNCIFRTDDDAIALNAHDYITSNPELGDIADGVIENCTDLASDNGSSIGYFSRILAGAWVNWTPGMTLHHGDAVVSGGKIYRLKASANGETYVSSEQPEHTDGEVKYSDGLTWLKVQNETVFTAAVSNVAYRNIILQKPRPCFSFHFDNDDYSHAYYEGAQIPSHHNISFDNIDIQFGPIFKAENGQQKVINKEFMLVRTPIDRITVTNSTIRDNTISFSGGILQPEQYGDTELTMDGCTFDYNINNVDGTDGNPSLKDSPFRVLTVGNNVKKTITFTTTNSKIKYPENFAATYSAGSSEVIINSDIISGDN